MELKNLKFDCYGPEHNAAIQKRLVDLGLKWFGGSNAVNPDLYEQPYLYVDEDGEMCYGTTDDHYNSSLRRECCLDDLYQRQEVVWESFDGVEIQIEGKKYKLTAV